MPVLVQKSPRGDKRHPLFKNLTRVGSDPNADVCVDDPDVASDHAQLIREDEDFVIASLGRGRPVLVNGKKEKRTRLHDGDVVKLGAVELVFSRHDVENEEESHVSEQASATISAYKEIVSFSERLLRAEGLGEILPVLMDHVIELTRADKGFLVLFEDEKPVVRVARAVSGSNIESTVSELSDSILQKVVREQQAVIVSDALHDKEFKSSVSVMNLRLLSSCVFRSPIEEKSLV